MDFNDNNNINEITSDFNKDMLALASLRDLKSRLEADGITKSTAHDVDTLVLTSFDNIELQKIKSEILDFYNKIEKEARTFFGFTYATIDDKIIAEVEYKEISSLRNKALNAGYDILLRKKILNKINNMSFHMKNAAPLLYDIDIACRTYNGFTYNSMADLDMAMHELTLVDEFIKIDEILDNTKDISAVINIKTKVHEIKKNKYSNSDINERLNSITKKLEKLEYNLRLYDGVRYPSLEEAKIAEDELYYIESESFKFDMLSRDGLKFFLELMSLREFQSNAAKNKIDKYRNDFLRLETKQIEKVKHEQKIVTRNKKKTKLKISIGASITTFILLIASLFSMNGFIIAAGVLVFVASLLFLLFYSIYYNVSRGVEFVQDKFNTTFKSKK